MKNSLKKNCWVSDMDINRVRTVYGWLINIANNPNCMTFPVALPDIQSIKNGLIKISHDIEKESPYFSQELFEMKDRHTKGKESSIMDKWYNNMSNMIGFLIKNFDREMVVVTMKMRSINFINNRKLTCETRPALPQRPSINRTFAFRNSRSSGRRLAASDY